MDKGDCVFFHPLTIHGSGANRTNGFRKAITSHYAAAECHYIDVRGTIQERECREVVSTFLNKLGADQADIDYDVSWCNRVNGCFNLLLQQFWKLRSRLVRGRDVNL